MMTTCLASLITFSSQPVRSCCSRFRGIFLPQVLPSLPICTCPARWCDCCASWACHPCNPDIPIQWWLCRGTCRCRAREYVRDEFCLDDAGNQDKPSTLRQVPVQDVVVEVLPRLRGRCQLQDKRSRQRVRYDSSPYVNQSHHLRLRGASPSIGWRCRLCWW